MYSQKIDIKIIKEKIIYWFLKTKNFGTGFRKTYWLINKNNFDALQWSLAEQNIGEGSPNMKVAGVAVGNFHDEP